MVDDLQILLSIRKRLLAIRVAVAQDILLSSNAAGFYSGNVDFALLGFVPGMQVKPLGFANELKPRLVQKVSPNLLTVEDGIIQPEAELPGRSLIVGLPDMRSWENALKVEPEPGRWFVEEDYMPGVSSNVGFGSEKSKILDSYPIYVLRLYGVSGTGVSAIYKVAERILRSFPPGAAFSTNAGDVVRVGTDPAPYRGQLVPHGVGHAVLTIAIPLWVRSRISFLAEE